MATKLTTRNHSRKTLYKQLAGTDAAAIQRRNEQLEQMMSGNNAIMEKLSELETEEREELKAASREQKEQKRKDQKVAAKQAGKDAAKDLKAELKGRKDLSAAEKADLVAEERRKARQAARAGVRAELHRQLFRPGGEVSKNKKKKFRGESVSTGGRGQHAVPCGNVACRRCFPAPPGVKDKRRWKRVYRYGYTVFAAVPA